MKVAGATKYSTELEPDSTSISSFNQIFAGLEDGVAFRARGSLGNQETTVVGETLGVQDVNYGLRGEPYSEEEEGQSYASRKLDQI